MISKKTMIIKDRNSSSLHLAQPKHKFMSFKCPNCGYEPPKGRPKGLDDKAVKALKTKGWSLARIAAKFGVTRGAIQAALKR